MINLLHGKPKKEQAEWNIFKHYSYLKQTRQPLNEDKHPLKTFDKLCKVKNGRK